jgi:hypothetical protein
MNIYADRLCLFKTVCLIADNNLYCQADKLILLQISTIPEKKNILRRTLNYFSYFAKDQSGLHKLYE